jgi:purine nucleosidase
MKIIIDTDPGVDDAVAILLALASPEVELLGLTTVAGNLPMERVHRNAKQILALAGRTDVLVSKGCNRPLMMRSGSINSVHGEDGLGGVVLPEPTQQDHGKHAVDFLIDAVMSNPGEVTICPIGPLTNIALAIIMEPAFVDNVKDIVLMGGAAFVPGNITPAAEFNFYVDPHAAHIVFDSARHITMHGLDVTRKADIRAGLCDRLETGGPVAVAAARMSRAYAEADPFLHDPCATAYLIDPSIFSIVEGVVEIEFESKKMFGHSLASIYDATLAASDENHLGGRKQNVKIVTDVKADALFRLISDRILQL